MTPMKKVTPVSEHRWHKLRYNAEGSRQDERSFPLNGIQSIDGLSQTPIGNINMKGYKEFSAQNRPTAGMLASRSR
jgi:hypothetical protein